MQKTPQINPNRKKANVILNDITIEKEETKDNY